MNPKINLAIWTVCAVVWWVCVWKSNNWLDFVMATMFTASALGFWAEWFARKGKVI